MKQSKSNPTLSIIIPVLNEEAAIEPLINAIRQRCTAGNIKEIIVVDGGSTDTTIAIATMLNTTILHSKKGRAKQMNVGANYATGDILYFLHADTIPPPHFDTSILNAINKEQYAGSFRLKFDNNSLFLNFFAWFTRINHKICRGGDQSLFITKNLFTKLNGYNEDYIIYEDGEFIARLYKEKIFIILPDKVITSARKYQEIGMLKLQYHFGMIHLQKRIGKSPEELYNYYKKNIAN